MRILEDILIKPIVTEKSTALGENLNRYSFIVRKDANKIQIKEAVEKMYEVSVTEVRTMVMPGKNKIPYTAKGLSKGRKPSFKKAIVSIAEGEEIDFYSNI